MCHHLSLAQNIAYPEKRFGADFEAPTSYEPSYHKAAFSSPGHSVITGDESGRIRLFRWGPGPRRVKDDGQAEHVRRGTYNARSEPVFDIPSLGSSILDRRCLVLADGFFEWHHSGGKKYPYHIRLGSREAFSFAGIWDTRETGGGQMNTFSVLTTGANPLMARMHNTKKRMPVILPREDERRWLEKGHNAGDIRAMLRPCDGDLLEAYTVSRLMSSAEGENLPEVQAPFRYREPEPGRRDLFGPYPPDGHRN